MGDYGRLRDVMLGELNAIGSDAETSKRAHPAACGRGSQATLPFHHSEGVPKAKNAPQTSGASSARKPKSSSPAVDKSILVHPELRRIRDHVRFVAHQSCLVYGRQPCDAHHLGSAQNRARGRRVSDEFTVPLCRSHHRELHRHGDETAWWRKIGLDPTTRARTLWLQTHPLGASKLAVGAADCSWPSRPTPDTSLFDSLSAQVLHSGLAKGCLRC